MICVGTTTAAAQLRMGLRAGTNIREMSFSNKAFDSGNRVGFSGGLAIEAMIPVVGLGVDASVNYVHRSSESVPTVVENDITNAIFGDPDFMSRDYVEIPLVAKYCLKLPGLGEVFAPFAFTGPSFAVLVSDIDINDYFRNTRFDMLWNTGGGVELFNTLQIFASYGRGMTDSYEPQPHKASIVNTIRETTGSKPTKRSDYWTIGLTYFF